jgi:hypothetical protein
VYEPSAVVRHFVPAARLHRRYFRQWLHQNGRDVARLERAYPAAATKWLGVPRYLWRQAASDAASAVGAALTGDGARRFASALRVLWFAGYLRDSWFAGADGAPPPWSPAEQR